MEDYKKKYEEALERAKFYCGRGKDLEFDAPDIASDIFPELKESEDEKIRKELHDFCMKCFHGETIVNQKADFQRWATWLEKRVEKPAWSEEDEKTIDEVISLIDMLASGYGEKVTESITFNGVKMINNIKERLRNLHQKPNHWKPSDEQMSTLDAVIDEYDGYPEFDSLVSLKNDLKKLREE